MAQDHVAVAPCFPEGGEMMERPRQAVGHAFDRRRIADPVPEPLDVGVGNRRQTSGRSSSPAAARRASTKRLRVRARAPMTDSPAATCVDEAAILVAAQPGGADRLGAAPPPSRRMLHRMRTPPVSDGRASR